MCGFAGIVNNAFPIGSGQLADVCRTVSFRGPDSTGLRFYDQHMHPAQEGNTAFFFNRLAIIDLDARSDQPFEDDRYTLLFNGEIYNYKELRERLQKLGFVFRTTSDTEVLFYALQYWGTAALGLLNGMFAFFWMDRQQRTFILGRDRVGIKPLYFRRQGRQFIFASELDSVLRLSSDLPPIDNKAVRQFLWMQFIPSPHTIVQEVAKLPPGHFLEGDWERLERQEPFVPRAYWDAYAQQTSPSTSRADTADLERILVDTLSRQLVADVPLGLFLSSGVDSSLLTALVNKHFTGTNDVNLFTVAFTENTTSDESHDAAAFIEGFGNPRLHSRSLVIDPGLVGGHLDRLYEFFDEPFGDPTALLNWTISIKAKEYVTVALSGDGADELFWGYGRYASWQHPGLSLPGNRTVGEPIASLLKPFLPPGYWRTGTSLRMEPDAVKRHFSLFLSPVFAALRQEPIWQDHIWALEGIDAIRHREDLVALLDIKTYLADAMLHKVDRASMAASLEVRVPYLDNKVIDYALALPFAEKSNNTFRHKAILKQLLRHLAPHYAIDRPKKGFNFPIDTWLRFHWRDKVIQLVNHETLGALGLEDDRYLDIVRKYYAGNKHNCIPVWFLLNLCLWYRKYQNLSPLQPL